MLNEGGGAASKAYLVQKIGQRMVRNRDGLNFTRLAYTVFICPLPPLPSRQEIEAAC